MVFDLPKINKEILGRDPTAWDIHNILEFDIFDLDVEIGWPKYQFLRDIFGKHIFGDLAIEGGYLELGVKMDFVLAL